MVNTLRSSENLVLALILISVWCAIHACMYIIQCTYVYVCSDLVNTRWRHFDYVYYMNVYLINSNYLFSYVFHTISKSVHCKLLWLNAAKKPIKFDCPNKQWTVHWTPSQQVWPALMVRNYDWVSKTVHLKATCALYVGLQILNYFNGFNNICVDDDLYSNSSLPIEVVLISIMENWEFFPIE